MASFRKRGELQWQARILRKGYPPQVKTFPTRVEAEAWARAVESEIDRGVFVSRAAGEATTLHEALQRYETEITVTKRGFAQEGSMIRVWQTTNLAKRPMAAVRSTDVAKLRDEWLKERKPATVLRRLALLSHLFTIARQEWGMEALQNPVELVRKPQPNNARTRRLSATTPRDNEDHGSPAEPNSETKPSDRKTADGELDRVMAASHSGLLPSIITLAVETAMRRSEIVGLLWENVDLNSRVAHLPSTKNGDSRDVPLSSRAVKALDDLKRAAQEERQEKAKRKKEQRGLTGRVFEIRNDAVTRAFERAVARARKLYLDECQKAGRLADAKYLTDLRFHDLRHEATSRLAEIFPMHELTKITGHKDPRMLMRYYHPRAEDLAKRLT